MDRLIRRSCKQFNNVFAKMLAKVSNQHWQTSRVTQLASYGEFGGGHNIRPKGTWPVGLEFDIYGLEQ